MRRFLLFTVLALSARGADWPMSGFDSVSSNCQTDESALSVKTIGGLVLLWHKHLGQALSSPVNLGRVITHRGFQELVFVTSSDDQVSAVDADLGQVLWQRRLDDDPDATRRPVTPVFTPLAPDVDGDDDDGPAPAQPLFVLSSQRKLFALRTISGTDENSPVSMQVHDPMALVSQGGNVTAVGKVSYSAKCRGLEFEVTDGKLQALSGEKVIWSLPLKALTPPVIANGLLYEVVDGQGRIELVALDEQSGRRIEALPVPGSIAPQSTLALANGHVLFTTAEGDLYCYGLPVDL